VNVSQARGDLPDGGTSLKIELGHELERESLLAAILNDLGNAYERADREGVGWIVPGWRSRSSMLGDAVTFQREGALIRGIAEDVSEEGALRVRLDDGSRFNVVAGEVERVRAPQS
jgi:BirA family biotin operon repressor/biotin-[acetyl-CoA-carboxylase] ligase